MLSCDRFGLFILNKLKIGSVITAATDEQKLVTYDIDKIVIAKYWKENC